MIKTKNIFCHLFNDFILLFKLVGLVGVFIFSFSPKKYLQLNVNDVSVSIKIGTH